MKKVIFLFLLTLFTSYVFSQSISVSPIIGTERGFSKKITNADGLPANFKNNVGDIYFSYGLAVSYQINDKIGIQFLIKKADAAFSYSYIHERDNSVYPNGTFVSKSMTAGGLIYTQLAAGPVFSISKRKGKQSSLCIDFFLNPNLSINIRANEDPNASKIILLGVNGKGQNYYTDDSIYTVKESRFSIPVQFQFQSYLRGKAFINLSILFNQGVTSSYKMDALYIVDNGGTVYKTVLQNKGTYLSIMMSYPIRIKKWKR